MNVTNVTSSADSLPEKDREARRCLTTGMSTLKQDEMPERDRARQLLTTAMSTLKHDEMPERTRARY